MTDTEDQVSDAGKLVPECESVVSEFHDSVPGSACLVSGSHQLVTVSDHSVSEEQHEVQGS